MIRKKLDNKIYIRDKRSPIPSSDNVSRVMSANKPKNTIPELIVRKELYKRGFRGYRLHPKTLLGKPDIVFVKKRIAIFVNGCFWHLHGCANSTIPKTNTSFWKNKLLNNKIRDNSNYKFLKENGWQIIILWECEVENNFKNIKKKLNLFLK